MYKIKRLLKRFDKLIMLLMIKLRLNNKILLFSSKKAEKNKVNINYWDDQKNIGDAISPIIVEFMAKKNGIDINKPISQTKHLYAVGSIITAGCQDCTIWGSGILNTTILNRLNHRKLDVRATRGPLTRIILEERGINAPQIYGDPAIIMPFIYNPDVDKKYDVSVITHLNEQSFDASKYHQIDILTDNYKKFIEEIKASRLIISSSLHGIILAEVYGIPAILLKPHGDMFKYYDYYYSTNRCSFPIANTVEEALTITPLQIINFNEMQKNIMDSFPVDLWQ